MSDMEKVMSEVNDRYGKKEISDACARVIASQYHSGMSSLGYSFASTGAIGDTSELWGDLFPGYMGMSAEEKRIADMMGTYLVANGPRPPVEGWATLWL